MELIVHRCPQCGAPVTVPVARDQAIRCEHCGCSLRLEAPAAPKPSPPPARTRREEEPAFLPRGEAALCALTLGRFEVALLRQAIRDDPVEAMVFLPLEKDRAAISFLRVVDKERGGEPLAAPMDALADAAAESLRAQGDPGLAVKAALRALDASKAPGFLEAYVAVLDSRRSDVVSLNAGCSGALLHASVEEARTINPTFDRGCLDRRALRGAPDAFANGQPLLLAAGDAVLLTSAGLTGDGRGWAHGQRSTFDAVEKNWGANAPELALAIKDSFWEQHARSHGRAKPPCGDLLAIAVRVRANAEIVPATPLERFPIQRLVTPTFELALAPRPDAFFHWTPLHSERHGLLWIEGLPEGDNAAILEKAKKAVLSLLEGNTGDNENPRRAGREALVAMGLAKDARVRMLVLEMNDRHSAVRFFTRGWRPGFGLSPRSERGGSLQHFDEGGHTWLKPGGRFVFPGELPITREITDEQQLATLWRGGKASSLYALAREHEEQRGSEAFLRALAGAARIDVPGVALGGIGVVTRTTDR
jgi:hypothetical protein